MHNVGYYYIYFGTLTNAAWIKIGLDKNIIRYNQYYVFSRNQNLRLLDSDQEVSTTITVNDKTVQKEIEDEFTDRKIYKLFFWFSQLGGLYSFLILVIGIIVYPIAKISIKINTLDSLRKAAELQEHQLNDPKNLTKSVLLRAYGLQLNKPQNLIEEEKSENAPDAIDLSNFDGFNSLKTQQQRPYSLWNAIFKTFFFCKKDNDTLKFRKEIDKLNTKLDLVKIVEDVFVMEYRVRNLTKDIIAQEQKKQNQIIKSANPRPVTVNEISKKPAVKQSKTHKVDDEEEKKITKIELPVKPGKNKKMNTTISRLLDDDIGDIYNVFKNEDRKENKDQTDFMKS